MLPINSITRVLYLSDKFWWNPREKRGVWTKISYNDEGSFMGQILS